MIKSTRVDYRLIHGQVAFAWTNFLGADCILVANDDVVKNDMRKAALRMAKPQGVKLVFKSIDDAILAINEGKTDKYKLFIVVETVLDALRLAQKCAQIDYINIGLINKTEGSVMLGKAVYANEMELQSLKDLCRLGIHVEMKQAPNDTGINVKDLLK